LKVVSDVYNSVSILPIGLVTIKTWVSFL